MSDDLQALVDQLEPLLAAVFIAAIATLRAGIDYPRLLIALRTGDIDAAIDALNIESGVFSGYVLERQAAFAKAGAVVSEAVTKDRVAFFRRETRDPSIRGPVLEPEARGPDRTPPPAPPSLSLDGPTPTNIVFRFDMQNPRAENRIRSEAATRVAGYVDEQVETARKVIADGFSRGEGPQTIATTIAGRVDPNSKRRQGGIVGLSDPQVGYVDSMRARLLSGDPDEMMKVLGRFDKGGKWIEGTGMTRRDRRYDGAIKRAIAAIAKGKPNPLTRDKIYELTAKYSDRLLAKRADDIARTETAQGVMMARAEATKQALDKSGLDDAAVEKIWRHLGGLHHARDWHLAMNGKSVTGIDAVFHMPDGSLMLHSHDPQGGAKNNVACRCSTDFDIDWAAGL
ncbi:hypothetical protein U5A82_17370 [Sphingobium sp. CR2-8]|uniref:hypothetical protein n=1 Tax=Sphingobium sp. CR2-8 TaxID=1306534 RepID=UPI002DBB4B46|nr:hypothetical protein [Sphingobium sp. CR2-8]MEC3912179.1 hypothetical protein [Sphingobium sp. CR2-8]